MELAHNTTNLHDIVDTETYLSAEFAFLELLAKQLSYSILAVTYLKECV